MVTPTASTPYEDTPIVSAPNLITPDNDSKKLDLIAITETSTPNDQQNYKDKVPSLAKRQEESANLRMKYPDKIPIICERAASSRLPKYERTKFLIVSDLKQTLHIFLGLSNAIDRWSVGCCK